MTYVYALLVILVVGAVGYIYISGNPQELFNKRKNTGADSWGPVDEFLAEPEPEPNDEPKVIFLGDIEAEKAKRSKKKD